eukprot:748003-Hanusia_phi.AAC.2
MSREDCRASLELTLSTFSFSISSYAVLFHGHEANNQMNLQSHKLQAFLTSCVQLVFELCDRPYVLFVRFDLLFQ